MWNEAGVSAKRDHTGFPDHIKNSRLSYIFNLSHFQVLKEGVTYHINK